MMPRDEMRTRAAGSTQEREYLLEVTIVASVFNLCDDAYRGKRAIIFVSTRIAFLFLVYYTFRAHPSKPSASRCTVQLGCSLICS